MSRMLYFLAGIGVGAIILLTIVFPAQLCSCYKDVKMSGYEGDGIVSWYMPVFDDSGIVKMQYHVTTDTGITDEDFREAMDSPMCRRILGSTGYGMSDIPDCPQGVVDGIDDALGRTGMTAADLTEHQLCVVISAFVRTGILYAYDDDLYGCMDYAASPTETVYLGRGDCEDVSILFVSIARAYGIDAVLIGFGDHCTAGIRVSGWEGRNTVDGYTVVECTSSYWYVDEIFSPDCGEGRVLGQSAADRIVDSYMTFCDRTLPFNPILYIARMLS